MEVHHHSHTERKKWTHYLWEFLMLFLAVFCGFLAENFREHKIETQREYHYMKTMIDNLKDDTAKIKMVIDIYEGKLESLNSLLSIRYADFAQRNNQEFFYTYCAQTLFNNMLFQSNDATLVQLRNSGGLRLIRKKGVADSITAYQQEIGLTQFQYQAVDKYFSKSNSILEKLVDETILFDTTYRKKGSFTERAVLSINSDKQLLKEFFNSIQIYLLIAKVYLNYNLKYDLESAEKLIAFLNRKYQFE